MVGPSSHSQPPFTPSFASNSALGCNWAGIMNNTTINPGLLSSNDISSNPFLQGLHLTLGAAFFGFSAGAILHGITLRQAFQYYTEYIHDSISRKSIIGFVCLLDTLHLAFAMALVYNFVLQLLGFPESGQTVLWSAKALGTVQTILIVFVQGFYLSQIWRLSGNLLLSRRFSFAAQIFVIIISILAVGVAIIFLRQLQKLDVILSFHSGFEYVIYLGFGTTALVDCAIAAAMCLILHKSSAGTERSESVLESLIQYFIGSGLLTSLAAILCIVLYVAKPNTLIYLGLEFSVTRLYANSVLAMFNARHQLRSKLNETIEVRLPSGVFFSEPDSTNDSDTASLISSNPFSPGLETKYEGSDTSSIMKGKHSVISPSNTVSRHYTV